MKYIVILLVVLVVLLVGILAFLWGRMGWGLNFGSVGLVASPSAAVLASTSPSGSVASASPSPSANAVIYKKVTGGGILSFPKYELSVPVDWTDSKQSGGADDQKVIVKKGEFEISITQGGFGGAVCLFPGDADVEGPSSKYSAYKEITTQSGDLFRRTWTGEEMASKGYGVCYKSQYGWGVPTIYGHISYITPVSKTKAIVDEMDAILASIKKI